uniref:hypothetical protein n=1 Tax=Labilibaculum sp. TaxID=2060723 RepID=UPI003564C3CD
LTTSPQFKNRPKGIKFKPAYILADGDFVYMQNRKKLPGKKVLIQHTFRLNEDGKIDEHWSTSTVVDPEKSKNPKALY